MGREVIANTVTVTVSPEGKTIPNIPWTEGMNAQTALERAYGIPPGLSFALQYYGPSLGYLVIMIDGTFDAGNDYWFFYVNGVLSPTGVDSTILNAGDVLGFVYESYDEAKHSETIYAAKREARSKR